MDAMATSWDVEKLYFDGDSYFDAVLKGIAAAQKSIELETYIFQPDALGRKIEHALIEASQRGILVRLLVDGIGAAGWIDRRLPRLAESGAEVRVYHPLKAANLWNRLLRDMGIRRRPPRRGSALLSRLNRRTHRKICVIDGQRAWVGSLNIAACHSKVLFGNDAWRDTGVLIEGDFIQELRYSFDYIWTRSHGVDGRRRWAERLTQKKSKSHPHPLLRLNHTTRLRWRNYFQLISRLRRAEKRIWITNAYLAPSPSIIRQLANAAARGVDVRILVPRKSDVFFMPWVARAHYEMLQSTGIRIFEYLPRFIHAKSLLIDDWATVGTSNMNRRSIRHDFEVDVILSHKTSLVELEEQFLKDAQSSEELHAPASGLHGFLSRNLGRAIIFLFKHWI